jgi:hypothetical protein
MRRSWAGIAAVLSTLPSCDKFDVPATDHGTYASCCDEAGTCVPAALVSKELAGRLERGACESALLCAPRKFFDQPDLLPARCDSDGEGRCLSHCLPEVAERSSQLEQASCDADELCVPCFDPRTREDTQACRLNGDAPVEPPRSYETCCVDRGRCVPRAVLSRRESAEDLERLGPDTCDEAQTALCVPAAWLEDTGSRATTCRTPDQLEGRCLLDCLPEVQARADALDTADCGDGELCVPCYDPIDGEDTGACKLKGDAPADAPVLYGPCCQQRGRCVPRTALERTAESNDVDRFAADSCGDDGSLCVPSPWLEDEPSPPPTCRAAGALEGRCLLHCLPEVAARAGSLHAADCSEGELCVPCFDPLTGDNTQACHVNGDAPAEPPRAFGSCCEDRARCIPREFVEGSISESDLARLDGADCPADSNALCIPSPWLSEPGPAAMSCRTAGDREGRCLLGCLRSVAERTGQLEQSNCEEGWWCVPCFDPIRGDETGACSLNGDSPRDPPDVFDSCCADGGRCLERELIAQSVSMADLARLGRADCSASAELCVPADWIGEAPPVPSDCRTVGDREGRCLLGCLPALEGRLEALRRESCQATELCVPCYDPLTGEDTLACRVGGDPGPAEPPRPFEVCCELGTTTYGTCVPAELLPAESTAELETQSCQDDQTVCVPNELLESPPGATTCNAGGTFGASFPGVCLVECFIQSSLLFLTSRSDCRSNERCVPCSYLPPSQPGCP